ncbi:PEP-CTERM sorting domain-containing protein [Pelobacter seleniigenes]|uniref:PEP-CTERM sorting domain-containing protein n=1 Tax=Pelobacter seleniigenes TaxID=407188 RepID=UPI0004A6CBFD|nr:PEP-CTERM sorting domain-containing protein [Pelobacter seleniigenes]
MKKLLVLTVLIALWAVSATASTIPYWSSASSNSEFLLLDNDAALAFGIYTVDDFNNPDLESIQLTTLFSAGSSLFANNQIDAADYNVFGFYVYNVTNNRIWLSDTTLSGNAASGDLYGLTVNLQTDRWIMDATNSENVWYLSFTKLDGATVRLKVYSTDIAPVPEPATLLLLGSGLIGLAFLKRKK